MIVLGINAVFHDPAAALIVDGTIVAAAEEERFSRRKHGKPCVPFSTWELPEAAARWCLNHGANVAYTRPPDIAESIAQIIAQNGIVAWFQGRSEFGPRALGHRPLLANPRHADNLARLNDVKGREQFRPVAPMTLLERAPAIFEGPFPSPYMLFTHRVKPEWAARIPAVIHVDGTARVQTVDRRDEPLVARMLERVERLTGLSTRRA
jgi:predicted NodU family carbamoyl transferase